MNNYMRKPMIGDIVFVRAGETNKKHVKTNANAIQLSNRFISKDYGRIIMFNSSKSNPIHNGFVKVESISERNKCYVAYGQNVPYDYYKGITPEEFYQALKVWGFVPEYETTIVDNKKYRAFAHLEKGLLVTCEEGGYKDAIHPTLKSIKMFVPNTSKKFHSLSQLDERRLGLQMRCPQYVMFDLTKSKITRSLRFFVNNAPVDYNWRKGAPILLHYNDPHDSNEDYHIAYTRIQNFKDDICALWNVATPEEYRNGMHK